MYTHLVNGLSKINNHLYRLISETIFLVPLYAIPHPMQPWKSYLKTYWRYRSTHKLLVIFRYGYCCVFDVSYVLSSGYLMNFILSLKHYTFIEYVFSGNFTLFEYPWVKGTKLNSSIWRNHDGTNMSDVRTNYISYSDFEFWDYLILYLYDGHLFVERSDWSLPFICECKLT